MPTSLTSPSACAPTIPPFDTTASRPYWSKPGPPGAYEELVYRQLRLQRMVELLIQGYSYRAIAREMGLARSTVLRMKYDAARLGILTRVPTEQSLLGTAIS